MHARVGLFSGTFDPIHDGHVALALEAIRVCRLDTVLFLPEAMPRHKPHVSAIDERVATIQQAISPYTRLRVAKLKAPSHTYAAISQELREVCKNNAVVLLIGSDVVASIIHWEDVTDMLQNVELCIGIRSTGTAASVQLTLRKLYSHTDSNANATLLSAPFHDASSSNVRLGITSK